MRETSPFITSQQQQQQQPLPQQQQLLLQQERTNLTLIVNDDPGLLIETGLTSGAMATSESGEGVRGEEEEETERRSRIPSDDRQEMGDVLTPLTDGTSPWKPHHTQRRASTASSFRSTSSAKREKLPPLMHNEPQYVLRVNVGGLCLLPNIQASDISLRASVNRVTLREIRASELTEEGEREGERGGEEGISESAPVIRVRLEVGAQVERFNLQPSSVNHKEQDAVIMLALNGLAAELLLSNATVLKDFFDDEYESDSPIPIQLRIENTTISLRESLDHTTETDSTTNVRIKSAEIHRGKKIGGTNLFPPSLEVADNSRHNSVRASEERTLHLTQEELSGLCNPSPAAVSCDSSSSANEDLLQTFHSFVQVFECHVRRHGGLKVQLRQPEHIAGLLQELEVSLGEEELQVEQERGADDAPPSYSETFQDISSTQQRVRTASSVSTTTGSPPQNRRVSLGSPRETMKSRDLQKVRQESQQELARLKVENDDLISQLMSAKMLLAERSQDLDEVTSECKKAKEELVTHKQVLENYQEHIERLLTENADLKMIMTSLQ